MKKVIVAVLVMLLWCNVGVAGQQQLINQHLKNKKLEPIEGAWVSEGHVMVVYKQGGQYLFAALGTTDTLRCGIYHYGSKLGENYFQYTRNVYQGEDKGQQTGCGTKREIFTYSFHVNNNVINWTGSVNVQNVQPWSGRYIRIWPTDLVAHNAKFKTEKDVADEEKVIADMVADAKKTCKVLGFKDGSGKFADCTLKLYTQKVDELVAEKQAANALINQNQTTTTTQSSGSNVTTIYDPVRDSKSLMQQGQKMLSGACTLGINC